MQGAVWAWDMKTLRARGVEVRGCVGVSSCSREWEAADGPEAILATIRFGGVLRHGFGGAEI
eukprot:COSAG02_NODE_3123_length_7322_cov_42.435553_3_plen_62_part_00